MVSKPLPFNHALAAEVRAHVARFAVPRDGRALWEVAITVLPWLLCWCLPLWCAPLQGLLTVRLFVVCVHDTGHRALFSKPWMNKLLGTIAAPLTSFAYNCACLKNGTRPPPPRTDFFFPGPPKRKQTGPGATTTTTTTPMTSTLSSGRRPRRSRRASCARGPRGSAARTARSPRRWQCSAWARHFPSWCSSRS